MKIPTTTIGTIEKATLIKINQIISNDLCFIVRVTSLHIEPTTSNNSNIVVVVLLIIIIIIIKLIMKQQQTTSRYFCLLVCLLVDDRIGKIEACIKSHRDKYNQITPNRLWRIKTSLCLYKSMTVNRCKHSYRLSTNILALFSGYWNR